MDFEAIPCNSKRLSYAGLYYRRALSGYSKMNHPRCVYINNRCGYQSITPQYLKKDV